MEIFEAIKTRRSVGKVKDLSVPVDLIEQIIEAATWAPNHHRTEPWRFFVLKDEGRQQLADTYVAIALEEMEDSTTEENQARIKRLNLLPYRAPVIITVAVEPSDNSKVFIQEEFAAVHAATQNMLLAAHALGLSAVWRTGGQCYEQKMKDLFGLSEKGEITGFIYIGYPDIEPKSAKRIHHSELTKWIVSNK